ncbi:MAG: penicillin-binding transpeptidase domain-containing protein, partial [Candidatus Caldatribacteriaceae bacterium]
MISRKFVQRTNFLVFSLFLLLCMVVGKLISVQIIQAERYRSFLTTRFSLNEVPPPRGSILDRQGEVLAKDVEAISIFACPIQIEDPQSVARELSQILFLEERDLTEKLSTNTTWSEIKRKVPLYLGE